MEPKMKRNDVFSSGGFSSLLDWIHGIFIALVIVGILNGFFFQLITVEQTSMFPTFESGDKTLLNKSAYWFSGVQRGDVVVFYKAETGINYIKRVIGLPGDTIEISNGRVLLNGVEQEESYVNDGTSGEFYITVPEGTYFVMGDNRNVSIDSRDAQIGCISDEMIQGKVLFVRK